MKIATIVRASRMPEGAPELDVAIVGAGACGLTAAIALREAGITCVLLERDAQAAGSTALSSGFVPAAGTRTQQAAGIADTAEAFAADIAAKSGGLAPSHLVRALSLAIPAAIDRLSDLGLEFEVLDGFLYPGHGARRMHALARRTGADLLGHLLALASRLEADIVTRSRVFEIWLDESDRVMGVGYETPRGDTAHLRCSALLLACNGFGGNAALVREHIPEMQHAIYAGHVGNDGSAIQWGHALGAAMADLSAYQGHGSWVVPHGILMTWAVMSEGGIQINDLGRRFHDETAGYSEAAVQVLAQPGGHAWNVFGSRQLALARQFPDFQEAERTGAVRVCGHAAQLAQLLGCDEQALDPAIERFGWPLYAVRITGALFHTQGGLDVDENCRVRKCAGGVFPNLWAAGGAARGVSGPHVWGYLSGNGLLSAIAGGWIAAHDITRTIRKDLP